MTTILIIDDEPSICMLLADEHYIREVIAFSKSQTARDLMAAGVKVVAVRGMMLEVIEHRD